jgi:hypothetical protein
MSCVAKMREADADRNTADETHPRVLEALLAEAPAPQEERELKAAE